MKYFCAMNESLSEARHKYIAELESIYGRRESTAIIDLLLDKCFAISRLSLLTNGNLPFETSQSARLKLYIEELKSFRPVQHIIGHVDFCGCVVNVGPDALIPRPETSEMMSLVFESWKGKSPNRIVDVCSGSGCIAVASARHFAGSVVCGIELSEKAIKLAEQNAVANNVDVSFVKADILDPSVEISSSSVDLVISNPPYICESERASMHRNVLDYEPEMALFVSDDDPLVFYSCILQKALHCLAPSGEVWFEMNEAKRADMAKLCVTLGFSASFYDDINGKNRFCKAIFDTGGVVR